MAFEDGVFATFYDNAVESKSKSKEKGYPVFEDVLYIKIVVPNQVDCVPRPMQEKDKERFPKSWEAYVTGSEPAESGFPLQEWPQLTGGELKVCQANKIKTVEQLAAVADTGVHRLGPGGMGLKDRAQKFLKSLGETDAVRKENKELKARIKKLEKQLKATPPSTPRKRLKVAAA